MAFGFLLGSRPRPKAGTVVAKLRRDFRAGLTDFRDDVVGHGVKMLRDLGVQTMGTCSS